MKHKRPRQNLWMAFLLALLVPILVYAYAEGPPAGATGGFGEPNCTDCHTGTAVNAGGGKVTITVSAPSYTSGGTYTITVTDFDSTQRRWGFELSARTQAGMQAGTLQVGSDGLTQIVPSFNGIQYITHTLSGTRNGTRDTGSGVSFTFTWVAPDVSAGPVVFNAAGNAANGDGTQFGDHIYTTSLTLPPQACTYAIDPANQNIPVSGGSNAVTVTAPDTCTWTASSNSDFLSVDSGSSGTGTGVVNYTVAANTGASARTGTLTIAGQTFTVSQAGASPPLVFDGGVVNNASFAPNPAPMAPGSIAAIFGSNMNDGTANPNSSFINGTLAKTLGAASVKINGFDAPVFYSFPSQIGVQIPYELAGQSSASLVLTVAGQSGTPRTIFLSGTAPGIFTLNQAGTGQGAILIANTDILAAPAGSIPGRTSRPATRGEIITIFCTGLGAVTPALGTGAPAGANTTPAQATVKIDGLDASVQYSGTAPGFVGLYQVNATVPNGSRVANDVTVTVSLGGQTSNTATLAVGP
jgi:uncharacterized protein (TIGR03437 family)